METARVDLIVLIRREEGSGEFYVICHTTPPDVLELRLSCRGGGFNLKMEALEGDLHPPFLRNITGAAVGIGLARLMVQLTVCRESNERPASGAADVSHFTRDAS